MAKRKRLAAKRKPHGKISSMPRGYFNSISFAVRSGYSFCRESFSFALRFFFSSEHNYFTVTVVGHCALGLGLGLGLVGELIWDPGRVGVGTWEG